MKGREGRRRKRERNRREREVKRECGAQVYVSPFNCLRNAGRRERVVVNTDINMFCNGSCLIRIFFSCQRIITNDHNFSGIIIFK